MKTWDPYLTVRAVQPVVAALEALGHDVPTLLADSRIRRDILKDSDSRVPHQAMMTLWQRARAISGDDQIGIHLAEAAPLSSFGLHAYALLSSPTLREAYRLGCRYQRLIHEVTDLTFQEDANEGVLRHALPGGQPVPRQPAEFLATLWVRFGRLIAGVNWTPRVVCFAHAAPARTTEHERVFQSSVRFSTGGTAMHIPNPILDRQNPKADPGLLAVLDHYANDLLRHTPRRITFSERVRARLMEELKNGAPTATAIARMLHMSGRTLHRDLQAEGVSFRELLRQLRQEQATHLLADSRVSIAEVGFLLGFSELSSFHRAFKRWSGQTPADFRAAALTCHSSPPMREQ